MSNEVLYLIYYCIGAVITFYLFPLLESRIIRPVDKNNITRPLWAFFSSIAWPITLLVVVLAIMITLIGAVIIATWEKMIVLAGGK